MKTKIKQLNSKVYFTSLVFLVVLTFGSCKITLIPNYDSEISKQIDEVTKQVDKFYLQLLENNLEGERAYSKFSKKYIDIEVELKSLFNKNKIRPLNENSTRICEITLELWIKYKNEHKKDDKLGDGLIKLNRKTFDDLFYAMQVAEKGKEIVSKPHQ